MKNRQTLYAVLLTALVAGLAYLGISRVPVERSPAPALGQAPTVAPQRLAKQVVTALPRTAPAREDSFPFRLRNTDAPIGDLVRNETALLLRNAFIDTALSQVLPIPDAFKAEGDPLTYIAQSRGTATVAFRRHIGANGGTIVSYIPNNAYLVRIDAAGAERLARWPGTQSVLPFEPYYKLEMKLLEMALAGQALPEGALLNVVLFPKSEPFVAQRLAHLGVEVISEDHTPFGAKLIARVPGDKLAALARLTGVQGLERYRPRRLANDLTRPRLGVEVYTVETNSAGAVTNVLSEDYLGLTGQGIYVNVNDTGVDDSHAAFGRRIKGPATSDPDGHGTFVAGIIAGDGAGSGTIKTNPPPGSFKDPDFKGMAPKAKLHVLKADDDKVNNHVSDSWLQTESANYHYFKSPKQKYALISNNSWEYEEENDYTWAAASYDAATRDALPDQPGDQQVTYVFPAGNSGAGTDNGLNASPNTITAPGTAKNVITVGAIESGREIVAESYTYETNTVTETDEDGNEVEKEVVTTTTNTPFAGMSDSNNEVAAFSSRGNVGIGIEGQYGRFKPDLVAPGTFIISTRSSDWKNSITSTNAQDDADALEDLNDELGDQYRYESGTSVAAPAISGILALMQEFYSKLGKRTNSPALMKALLINSAASVDARYNNNVRGTVNHQGWGLPNLQRAAPVLVDENPKDEDTWPMRFIDQSPTNALATGESRSWEITISSNALYYPMRFTLAWTDPPGNPNAAVKLVNDLDLIVTPISSSSENPNDPADPDDPSDPEDESEKIEEVYYGNNIGASVYSSMGATNDVINNVENVFIEEPSTRNYRVTVYARRVNVDSLSVFYDAEEPVDHIDVVQDFALVMSSANPEIQGVFDDVKIDKPEVIELPAIASLTNGMPMLHQRVGANSALAKENDPAQTVYANRRGITNQWHFYTFVNAPKKKEDSDDSDDPGDPNPPDDPGESGDENQPSFGKHVAFITFMPPNLSSPRHREADIDLYVSRDSNLTNLEPAVLDAAFRSTERGGTEFITFDDAKVDESEVFYIAVKSEDQMAAEYGLVGLSTDNANGFSDDDGNIYMLPIPAVIPDGSAANPGGVSIFGVYTGMPYDYVRKVTATSIIHHEEVGDLWGQLSHNRNAVVLNNHTLGEPVTGKPYPTDFVFVYDDELDSSRIMPGSIPTDGPGSLNDFQWEPAMGVWQLDMVDSALTFTGLVEHLNVKVDAIKNLSLIGNRGIDVHLDPGESEDFLVEVPFNATNMIVQLTEMTGPVDVYIRKDIEPDIKADPAVCDKSTIDAGVNPGPDGTIGTEDDIVEWDGSPPRGELHYGLNDLPPLSEGRWFVTIDNPELTEVDFHLKVIFEYDISLNNTIKLVSDEPEPIEDDIVTKSILTVTNDFLVGMAEVGVRIDHPRIADMDLHLVSPQGTRLLLSENRGHTNIAYGVTLTEETDTVPVFEDGFELADNDFIDDSAKFHSGWELDSGEVYVYRTPQAGLSAHSGEQFVEMNGLEPGTISTNALTEVDKVYRLRFAYAKNPDAADPQEMKVFVGTVTNLTITASVDGTDNALAWKEKDIVFTAESSNTRIRFKSLEEEDYAVMLDSVRLDEVTPANLYAVFSELENLAKGSMKFGDAPYAKEEEQVLFSGFEDAPLGLAKTNDIIDDWTVLNTNVRVSRNNKAHSGTQFATLSLNNDPKASKGGTLWRDLPTAVGQDYRLSFATHATSDDAEFVLGGVVTNRVEGAISLTNAIPQSADWITNTVRFTAARSSTPLTIHTKDAAVRLDTVELIGPGPHNLAEEPLDVLSGERAMGDWVLEVRDHRVGVDPADTDPDIEPVLLSWYIKIMGSEAEDTEITPEGEKPYTRDDTAEALEDGKKVRGRIYDNETHYWSVETCSDSTKLTVELSSGKKRNNAKVSLLASYGGFPSGDSAADDYVRVDMNDSYFAELVLDDSGHLPLQPGELLYLTVQKTDTNVTQRAMYDILAKWDGDCGEDTPPDTDAGLVRLASAEGSEMFRTQPGAVAGYLWSIPAGTKSALLEVVGLTGDIDFELISADGRHFRNSINLGQVPEQIVLREGVYIPSLGGDWVVHAKSVESEQNEFTLHTTLSDEQGHLISSQPIELEIEGQYWPPTVRLAWPSVPGERYLIESSENLSDWAPVHEQTAGSSGLVFHAERSWFGERYYRVKQLTGDD